MCYNSTHCCYFISYFISYFWVYDYSFRDKNINIDTSKVKVPAPNADEVFSACKQQNWSCYGKKVYEPKDSAGLKYFQTNLRIYNPLNIYNRMFIKIYKWDNLQGSSNLISINSSIPFSALRKGRTFEWWGRGGGWHHVALKQCPVCKNVLCSICSKATIKTDDTWLIMILAAKHNAMKISKQLFDGKDDVLSDI